MKKPPVDAAAGNGEFSPAPKKKRKVGFKNKMALLEIIRRKQFSDKVDYRGIAARHGGTAMSWKSLYYLWKCGRVNLGEAETPQEKTINAQMQHELTLMLVKRHKALILKGYEQLLNRAEDGLSLGKLKAADLPGTGLASVLKELRNVMLIQHTAEKGYLAVLDEFMQRRQSHEKPLNGTAENVTRQVHAANDEKRALELLDLHLRGPEESGAKSTDIIELAPDGG